MKSIELKLLHPHIPVPTYSTPQSAAIDLRAMSGNKMERSNTCIILQGECIKIRSGIAVHINSEELAMVIIPRSGLGSENGIILANGTGLIDGDYQGEIALTLWNRSSKPFEYEIGDRLAQAMFIPVVRPSFILVDDFSEETERGDGGFGHTGKN